MLGPNYLDGGSSSAASASTPTPTSTLLTSKPVFAVIPPTPITGHADGLNFGPWLELAATTAATSFYEQPPPSPIGSPSTISHPNHGNVSSAPSTAHSSPANHSFNRPRKRNHTSSTSPSDSLRQPVGKKRFEREIPRSDAGGSGYRSADYAMSVHSNNHDDRSHIAPNAYFPEIPKILPHEKVGESTKINAPRRTVENGERQSSTDGTDVNWLEDRYFRSRLVGSCFG